jgi:probable phosphoglycerate mutase
MDMLDYTIKKHDQENVLLVTHMDPIKSVIAKVMDLKPSSLFELIIANCSLTIIKHHDEKLSLSAINSMDADRFSEDW